MKKVFIGGLAMLLSLFIFTGCTTEEPNDNTSSNNTNEQQESQESSMTTSQKNAVRKAEQYLRTSAFSRDGLISQLEFEQFSTEDATFAVDHIEVDWNEQAAKKAKQYLDISAFSRDGLINQLEFDKFTTEQATYGVEQNGL